MPRLVAVALLAVVALSPRSPAAEPTPRAAVLDVLADDGAVVTVDGKGAAAGHTEFVGLAPGELASHRVEVKFKGGKVARRDVLLQAGWGVRLPIDEPGAPRPEVVVQIGHSAAVFAAAFSPDGKRVLTGSYDRTAVLWDADSGRRLRSFLGHSAPVWSVAFSPDGKRVLTGSSDGTAVLWDAAKGERLRTFPPHKETVRSVAFSPDGKRALTASDDGTAVVWDADTGGRLTTLDGKGTPIAAAVFAPRDGQILTGSKDGTATLWDAAGKPVRSFKGHTGAVVALAVSPDGKQVLTGSLDGDARLWDAAGGRPLKTLGLHRSAVHAVAFSPDGKQVVTGSADNTAALWDAADGERLREFRDHKGVVYAACFSPDGKQVLTGSADRTAALFDVRTGRHLRTFDGADRVMSLAFAADGKKLLTGSDGRVAALWGGPNGGLQTALRGHGDAVWSVALGRDGRRALTGSGDRTAILWDAATGKALRKFTGRHTKQVTSVALSPDGKRVLTGSADKTAVLWDADTGGPLGTFNHDDGVTAVAFSPDGRRVLTGSDDKTAVLWDAETRARLRRFGGHANAVLSLAFSPDGKRVLTGSADKSAVLWDAETGARVGTFKHDDGVTAVAFSPDGRRVLTGSDDKTAVLWDAATGRRLRAFGGHGERVWSVAISGDGRHVLTGPIDGTARLWDVATGEELARLVTLGGGRDWLAVTPRGLFDGSPDGRQLVSYRVGDGLTVVPVDRFFQDFYRPGLLAALLDGERPVPQARFARSSPPRVRILAPSQGGTVTTAHVTVEIEAVDQGGGVEGPWLFHEGSRVLGRGETTKDGKALRRTFDVALVRGDNRLEARAASEDGSWESEPASVTLRYERPLDKPTLYVVAIGISAYAREVDRLKFARADAEAVADLFRSRGKALYKDVKAVTLTDKKATRDNIREEMGRAVAAAGPQDTLLLFLAGHGERVGQRYYFIPQNFESRPGKSAEEDVRDQGVRADELCDFLSGGQALKRVLILDTCAAGGVTDLFQATSRELDPLRHEVERLNHETGVHVLAAATDSQSASGADELAHGILTYALLAGLKATDRGPLKGKPVAAASPAGVVTVGELFEFAAFHVPRLARQYKLQEQTVQSAGRGSSFPLLPLAEPEPSRP